MRRVHGTVLLTVCGMGGCAGTHEAAPPLVVQAPTVPITVVQSAAEGPPVEPAPARVAASASTPQQQAPAWREVFPHVQVHAGEKAVRFDGLVPIDAHDEKSPWVFLEVAVCTPDTKEHEALVMTQAKAANVHAALLLVGLEPGHPGRWKFENDQLVPIAPEGPRVKVAISFKDGAGVERTYSPEEMVVNAHDASRFGSKRPGHWVFAGSQIIKRMGKEFYDADPAGTLVGLTTFGSETVAWSEMISHEAAIEEPAWIADARTVPPAGTPVTVTITPAE